MNKKNIVVTLTAGLLYLLPLLKPNFIAEAKEMDPNFISESDLQEITIEIGGYYDIDPCLLCAVCETESSRNINAENGLCKGLMQVSTKWHTDRMERLGVTDIFNPYGNILVSADYLSELLSINEDPAYALMRYNMSTAAANELYEKGIISNYAASICERTAYLHKEGYCYKQETEGYSLPKGGIAEIMDN